MSMKHGTQEIILEHGRYVPSVINPRDVAKMTRFIWTMRLMSRYVKNATIMKGVNDAVYL
jgi:hypothetical protein